MKKQTEEISKKYDFFDNEDDKKNVKIKKESDTKMDETETIPYASPKRENDIDDSETIVYSSLKRESEDEIDQKIYKEPKLETAVETEKQAVENEKKFIKSELEQNKVDVKIEKESDIKKVQDVFEEVKKEEPIMLKISLLITIAFSTVKKFLMQIGNLLLILLTEQILLPMLKDSLKNQIRQKWKLFILRKKKKKRKNKC